MSQLYCRSFIQILVSSNKRFAVLMFQWLQGGRGRPDGAARHPIRAGQRPAASHPVQLPVQPGARPEDSEHRIQPARDPAADPQPLPSGKTFNNTSCESH